MNVAPMALAEGVVPWLLVLVVAVVVAAAGLRSVRRNRSDAPAGASHGDGAATDAVSTGTSAAATTDPGGPDRGDGQSSGSPATPWQGDREANEAAGGGDPSSPAERPLARSAPGDSFDTGPGRTGTTDAGPEDRSGSDARVGGTVDTGPAADGRTRPPVEAGSETDDAVERTNDTGPAADGSTRFPTDVPPAVDTGGAGDPGAVDESAESSTEREPEAAATLDADTDTHADTDTGSRPTAEVDSGAGAEVGIEWTVDTDSSVDDLLDPSTADGADRDAESGTDDTTDRESVADSPADADSRADRAVTSPLDADTLGGYDDGPGESTADGHDGAGPDVGESEVGSTTDDGSIIDTGEVDVVEVYTTVRRRLERELDIDGRWTTRQFYHACQMRNLDEDRLAALERLTRAYERVQDGDEPAADPEELRTAAAVFGLD